MGTSGQPTFVHDPSLTAVFAALPQIEGLPRDYRPLKAVVIGGGTGAPVSIRTLLSMGIETSAVVAMADDGGSTGILRDEVGATTPGDIRKCITAMAANPEDPLTQAFKTRFPFAENHTLGNLMLSTLESTAGGFPEAIAICERLLDARGHVYPSTLARVTLVAKTRDGNTVRGQAIASHSRSALEKVTLESEEEIQPYSPALEAIRNADIIVLGPGSLFTSVIPNLLVPGICESIRASKGVVVFVCSLADMQGETRGMDVYEHYHALENHGLAGAVDYMLVHGPKLSEDEGRHVEVTPGELAHIRHKGVRVLVRNLIDEERPTWHDPAKLRVAFMEVLDACRSTQA